MENEIKTNPQNLQIQGLLDRYLSLRVAGSAAVSGGHLDQDSLTAFTEGTLSRRETEPMIRHLVDCGFCRNITAELVRLNLAFAQNEEAAAKLENRPVKVSEVLSGILSRIFGSSEAAVFAHEEKEEDPKPEDEKSPEIENQTEPKNKS